MDADYGRNLDRDGAPTKAFEPSLFVWATVMSRGGGPRLRRRQVEGVVDQKLSEFWKINLAFYWLNYQFTDEINFSSLSSVLDTMVYL
jgi:hypothetical protein